MDFLSRMRRLGGETAAMLHVLLLDTISYDLQIFSFPEPFYNDIIYIFIVGGFVILMLIEGNIENPMLYFNAGLLALLVLLGIFKYTLSMGAL